MKAKSKRVQEKEVVMADLNGLMDLTLKGIGWMGKQKEEGFSRQQKENY